MFVLDSNGKGNIAEQAVVLAAMRAGVPVLRPVAEHGRVDMAFETAGRLWRVQCKWGRLSPDGDTIIVQVGGCYHRPAGYHRHTYTLEEVDLFAVYCGDLDRCFLLPAEQVVGRHVIHLRLKPPRNGQRACVTLAANFDFPGAIAQLGERDTGSVEVAGSSPASSTSTGCTPTTVGCNPFRDAFGEWIDRVASGEEVIVTRRGKPLLRLLPAA
jgi:prevent-host-death family protein